MRTQNSTKNIRKLISLVLQWFRKSFIHLGSTIHSNKKACLKYIQTGFFYNLNSTNSYSFNLIVSTTYLLIVERYNLFAKKRKYRVF